MAVVSVSGYQVENEDPIYNTKIEADIRFAKIELNTMIDDLINGGTPIQSVSDVIDQVSENYADSLVILNKIGK
jgi:hypothetical protein